LEGFELDVQAAFNHEEAEADLTHQDDSVDVGDEVQGLGTQRASDEDLADEGRTAVPAVGLGLTVRYSGATVHASASQLDMPPLHKAARKVISRKQRLLEYSTVPFGELSDEKETEEQQRQLQQPLDTGITTAHFGRPAPTIHADLNSVHQSI